MSMADIPMKSIQWPGLPDTYTFLQKASSLTAQDASGKAADAAQVNTALGQLQAGYEADDEVLGQRIDQLEAEIDTESGEAPTLVAGTAEQLLSTTGTVNPTPYTYRENTSGSDRVTVRQITGGTVAWNQLDYRREGNAVTDRHSAMWMLTASKVPYIYSGHIYLFSFVQPTCAVYQQSITGLQVEYKIYPTPTTETRREFLVQASGNRPPDVGAIGFAALVSKKETTEESYALKDKQIFDLTQMFGATVAQHFLDLETATPGSGVALFRTMFPESYYPYNAGELVSVQTSGRKTVGFNQWDEVWELGNISSNTGANIVTSLQIRSKNYIRVMPNTTYYFKSVAKSGGGYAYYYDGNKAFVVGGISITRNSSFTTPAGVCYMRFVEGQSYGTTYNHDICINISDPSRNGQYEPCSAHTYPLDSALTLRGIPVLTDGKIAYDGDQYAPNGTVTRRFKTLVLNGTERWSLGNYSSQVCIRVFTNLADARINSLVVNDQGYDGYQGGQGLGKIIIISNVNRPILDAYVSSSDYPTVDKWVEHLQAHPMTIVYELATPTTETAAPYQEIQIAGSTEEFLPPATDTRAAAVPVGSVSLYQTNLREGLEKVLTSIDSSGLEYPYAFLKDENVQDIVDTAVNAAGYPYDTSGSSVTIHPVSDSRIDFVAHVDPVLAAPSNLVQVKSDIFPKEIGGVTYTYDGKGTITANGTNTGTTWQETELQFATVTLYPGHYYFKGCPSGGGTSTYRMRIFSNSAGFSVYEEGSGVEFDVTNEIPNAIIRFSPAYGADVTFTNTKMTPVLYSYDQSPNNPRPIIAPETVTVTRTGANMINVPDFTLVKGTARTKSAEFGYRVRCLAGHTYYLCADIVTNTLTNANTGIGLRDLSDGNADIVLISVTPGRTGFIYSTFQPTQDYDRVYRAYAFISNNESDSNATVAVKNVCLIEADTVPTATVPFESVQSVTVTLPSGTYGGDYDSHGTFAPMRFATLTGASRAGANAGSIAGQLYISNGSSQVISTSGIMDVKRFFCSLYKVMPYAAPGDRQDGCIYFGNSRFYIYDTAHMTSQDSAGLDAYFSWLDSVGGLSICAPYDPSKAPAATAVDAKTLRATSTAQLNHVWTNNGTVDVSGATDLKWLIDSLHAESIAHGESIAPVQGATASTNIASGELLMQDGKLHTATQPIVAGAEIGDTNTTTTTIAAQLAALEARIAALEN